MYSINPSEYNERISPQIKPTEKFCINFLHFKKFYYALPKMYSMQADSARPGSAPLS